MASKSKGKTGKSSKASQDKAKATRDKVRKYRERMRKLGMRPIQIWVPDVNSPRFLAEARRQARLIARSPQEAEDQAWVDSMSAWPGDDE
jgi:hypothetical protein